MSDEDFFATADKMLAGMDFAAESAAQRAGHRQEMVRTLSAFLPVIDSLEALQGHCAELAEQGHREVPSRSVDVLVKQAFQALASLEVEPMNATDGELDLDLHEVVGVRAVAGVDEDTVLEETLRGYLWKGELLRGARVVVAGEPQTDTSRPTSADLGEKP